MSTRQQLSLCLDLVESMNRFIRAGKWHKLSALESEYSCAFEQLKAGFSAASVDADDMQTMIRLEQQQRRMRRVLSRGLKETGEKLAVIEDARKRLNISSQVAATLA